MKSCAEELPPKGVVVNTSSANGLVQKLKREGNLWFAADGSMYVYYSPVAWEFVEADAKSKRG